MLFSTIPLFLFINSFLSLLFGKGPSKLFKNYQLCYFTNLDKKELIGCGAFGNVYRGCMWGLKNPIINSKLIAVKVSHHKRGDIFKQWQVSNQFFYIPYMSVYIHNDTYILLSG